MSILGQIPLLSWRADEREYVSISERGGERVRRGHYPGWVSWESGGADDAAERAAGGVAAQLLAWRSVSRMATSSQGSKGLEKK